MNITVYGKPDCILCRATTKRLKGLGLAYNYVDITEDSEAGELILKMGYTTAPVVVVKHGIYEDSWCGFRDTKIKGLVGN